MVDAEQNVSKSSFLQILSEANFAISEQIRELSDKSAQQRRQYFKKDDIAYRKVVTDFNSSKIQLINSSVDQIALNHNINQQQLNIIFQQFFYDPDVVRALNELGNGKQWGNETIPQSLDIDKFEEILKYKNNFVENILQADSFRQED